MTKRRLGDFPLHLPSATLLPHNVAQNITLTGSRVRTLRSSPKYRVLRTYFRIVMDLLRTALPPRHDFAVRVAGSATQPECHRGESIKPV
jgi:hypothetical protein